MTNKHLVYNRKILFGCGVVVSIFLFGLALSAILSVQQERMVARYPGSIPIASHSNYTGLPARFRWDDTYRTNDSFTDVYNWYSVTFDLGAESRANGRCLLLEGSQEQLFLQRYITVFLCNSPEGQMIFVSRFTSIRNY